MKDIVIICRNIKLRTFLIKAGVKLKIFKRIIIGVLLIIVCAGAVLIGSGYKIYKTAINQMPIEQKVKSIKEKEN